jgi:serine/threonine protein kinase
MLASNSLIQNRYQIIHPLGQGGMGTVYLATDLRLDCLVALKETTVVGDEVRKAFQREASLLANLRHRALPNVMDFFTEPNGQFLVMQYIPGHDLASLLTSRLCFEVDEVTGWAETLLETLEFLHGRNPPILHRDIKPSNLKLTEDGELFLLDFGLAKGSVGQMQTIVQTQSMIGHTPIYAPLEQIIGKGTDPRSDLYSLGATLYHLTTGTKPIGSSMRFDAIENGNEDPLPSALSLNPKVPPEISAVLANAMAMKKADRPESAKALREAFRKAVTHDSETIRHAPLQPKSHVNIAQDRGGEVKTKRWDGSSFFVKVLEKRGRLEAEVAMKILAWCKDHFSRIEWGKGKIDGSFFPILDWNATPYYVIVVYTYGKVELQFQHMKVAPFDDDQARLELLNRFNQIPGVSLGKDSIRRRPSIPLGTLTDENALATLFDVLGWAIQQVLSEEPKPATSPEPWNGEFYVSYGVSESRSWEDARHYNFICGGGGRWYSQTLDLLEVGDRVWVKAPGYGFVGVGLVQGRAESAKTFKVKTADGDVPILDVAKGGKYHREFLDDPDRCEYFVPVRWLQTVPLQRGVHEAGMFGNQNTVCKPTTAAWKYTVRRLEQHFPQFDQTLK